MKFSVIDDRLYRDGVQVEFTQSPNLGGRMDPDMVVLHDTADRPGIFRDTINWFLNRKSRVSAHLVVGRQGEVTQMAPLDQQTWHAGSSKWKGVPGVNRRGIGIEMDNPGRLISAGSRYAKAWFGEAYDIEAEGIEKISTKWHGSGYWMPYTPIQVETVCAIVKALTEAYAIDPEDVVGHFHISPGRKVDPCPHWNFPALRERLDGPVLVAPDADKIFLAKGHRGEAVKNAQRRLVALGYNLGKAGADGIFGPRTLEAVLAWEAHQGRETNGTIDQDDYDVLTSVEAKERPASPVDSAEKDAAEGAKKAVNTTSVVSLGLLGTGTLFPEDGWSMFMGEIDRLSALASKLVGLGLKIPPHLVMTVLAAIVVSLMWRWALKMGGSK